jgi:hypothetical protein
MRKSPAIQSSSRNGKYGQFPQRRTVSARARNIPKPSANIGLAKNLISMSPEALFESSFYSLGIV